MASFLGGRFWLRSALGLLVVATVVLAAAGCFTTGDPVTASILHDAERRRAQAFPATRTPTPPPPPPTSTPEPTLTLPPGRSYATVRRVWDGNTILIDGGYSVR